MNVATPEDANAFLRRMGEGVAAIARRCTTPIYGRVQDGRPVVVGTGVLLKIGERGFLITASHVIEMSDDHRQELHALGPGTKDANGVLHRKEVSLVESKVACFGDPSDVAIIDLTDTATTALTDDRFIRLHLIDMKIVQPGEFWVIGYPRSRSDKVPGEETYIGSWYAQNARLHPRPLECIADFDPAIHFALRWETDNLIDQDGRKAEPALDLGGISGCGVWRVCSDGENPNHWCEDRIRLVGVETGVKRRSHLIKATRWEAVGRLFWSSFPDLRGHLELNGIRF